MNEYDKYNEEKYGKILPSGLVSNEILGYVRPEELLEKEKDGVVVYRNGRWLIPTFKYRAKNDDLSRMTLRHHVGEEMLLPTNAWNKYENELNKDSKSFKPRRMLQSTENKQEELAPF